jgi:hypothetical protein
MCRAVARSTRVDPRQADSYRTPSTGNRRCHNRIINVYSSHNLYEWRYRGVALVLHQYVDRPRVVRNRHGQFVMWFKVRAHGRSPLAP